MSTVASEVQANEPSRMLVLPEETSPDARICTLAHPRTAKPSRYYFCPEKGIFEFTRIAAPNSTCHSWLLAPEIEQDNSTTGSIAEKASKLDSCAYELKKQEKHTSPGADGGVRVSKSVSEGYVIKTPEVLVAAPIDPLFLLLPSLHSKKLFLSNDDILDELCDASRQFKYVSSNERARRLLEKRMNVVCDVVEAGDEKMYRLNTQRLLKELLAKARKMVAMGLPTSMEDRFIRKALETPVVGLKREQSSLSDAVGVWPDEASVSTPVPSERTDSQLSLATSASAASDSSLHTNITIPDDSGVSTVSDDIKHLLRIRTALSYMISASITTSLGSILNHQLSSAESPIDFSLLDEHLAHLTKMRAEVLASRSLSDFSRKRGMNEDDEAAETRAEKKRKKEEEEKRKKIGETRGLRDLKKVDTSGMKKMSDFFGKGAVTKMKK